MIEGHCHTNLDKYKKEMWPTRFAAVPREGEWVESESGAVLKVVKVTHKFGATISVELNKVCNIKF